MYVGRYRCITPSHTATTTTTHKPHPLNFHPPKHNKNTKNQAFLLGALSRAVATVILFPWIRVRKQIMAQRGGTTKSVRSYIFVFICVCVHAC